ncbi:MAG TPA: hypothetical protein VGD56_11145 [Gemmatirosa sp.]
MDRVVVEHYLARAAAAASVRELHALARAVRVAHEGDPDAERIEQACWAAALRLVSAVPTAPRAEARSPEQRSPEQWSSERRSAGGWRPAADRVDWKERAAPA